LPGPAASTPEPNWRRALTGIDEPANVPTRNPEQFGEMLYVEHDGGRGHTFPVGSTLDGRLNTRHGESPNRHPHELKRRERFFQTAYVTPHPSSSVWGVVKIFFCRTANA